MVGDIVYVPHFGKATHYGKVKAILESGRISVTLDDSSALCDPKGLEPIPLTSEILEKNGFEKTSCGLGATVYTFSDDDEYYAIAIDEYTDSIWRIEYTNCEFTFLLLRIIVSFVHELQHALRLWGISKEITL